MKFSARAYDALRPKQMMVPGPVDPSFVDSMSGGVSGVPDSMLGDATSAAIGDYLSEMTAADQRQWREKNIWADIAIKRRQESLRDRSRYLGPIDPKRPHSQALADEIRTVLWHPNLALENNTFGGLWGAAIDDMYTIGHAAIHVLLNKNRTPRGFRALDAARLTHNPHWDPDNPLGAPRYYFLESLTDKRPLMYDEVITLVPYLSTHDRTGLSPMRALRGILQAELDTRRKMHYAQKYSVPPGAFIMPGAAPGSPQRMRLMYDMKAAGRPVLMFMNLPKDSRFINFSDLNLINQGTFQSYEIFVRATAAAFGTTPFNMGWTDQAPRANAQTQLAISDRGEVSLLKFVREQINGPIFNMYRRAYGSRVNNLWFTFTDLRDDDKTEEAQSLRTKLGGDDVAFISINDARVAAGHAPYTKDELPPAWWPFVSEVWVPSRLRGVRLPVSYAAMSFGIAPGLSEDEILDALMSATSKDPPPLPAPGEAIPGNEAPPDPDEVDDAEKQLLRLVKG